MIIRIITILMLFFLAACSTQPPAPISAPGKVIHKQKQKAEKPRNKVTIAVLIKEENGTLPEEQENVVKMISQYLENIKLEIIHYNQDADSLKNAVEKAEAIGAKTIIGPIYSHDTKQVKQYLGRSKIKVVSLSNDKSLAGGNVFIYGIIPYQSGTYMLDFMDKEGAKIYLLLPANYTGEQLLSELRNYAVDHDILIYKVDLYDPSGSDFHDISKQVEELVLPDNEKLAIVYLKTPKIDNDRFVKFRNSLLQKENVYFASLNDVDNESEELKSKLNNVYYAANINDKKTTLEEVYFNHFGHKLSKISILLYDLILNIEKNSSNNFFAIYNGEVYNGINGSYKVENNVTAREFRSYKLENNEFELVNENE